MKYFLDTDILVDYLRKKKELKTSLLTEGCITSLINKAELLYGVYKSNNIKRNLKIVIRMFEELPIRVIEIDDNVIDIFAQTKVGLEKMGKRLDDFDLLIAATAIANNLVLITRNIKHYKRIPKLKLRHPEN